MKFEIVRFDEYQYTDRFLDFCKDAGTESSKPASANMWSASWENDPQTLPYKLLVEKLYSPPRGVFHLLLSKNKIVACSGAYESNFCSELVLAGVRTWVSKDYRNLLLPREYLLPAQKKFARDLGYKAVALSFNEYNKNIISLWERRRLGEHLSPREVQHLFYQNFNQLPFPIEIQYTKQWLIYEELDSSFDFDWSKIKWSGVEESNLY